MPKKKEEAVQGHIANTTEKRRLFHEFTFDDINTLNAKVTELTKKKEEFSEEAKLHASIAKGAECEIKKTLQALDEGGEEREMECPVIIDYKEGTYTVKHPETDVVVETRPLKTEERQEPLFKDEQGANEMMDAAVGGTAVEE